MIQVSFPGYFTEKMPSGNLRHRVRVKGNERAKITLPFGPEDSRFQEAYESARMGIKVANERREYVAPSRGALPWLVEAYLNHLLRMTSAGEGDIKTYKQRRSLANQLLKRKSSTGISKGKLYSELPMTMPEVELMALRDDMADRQGARSNMFKFLRAMYSWGVERGHCKSNPAAAIRVPYKSKGGAVPWSMEDLKAYRRAHPPGSKAHLVLTLFMFTACRIEDAIGLGRGNEYQVDGQTWLHWQPGKKGSRPVDIPMLPPLRKAIDAQVVVGETYLLTGYGKPFSSPEGLRNYLKKRCDEAGLKNRSSHGIRKAAGHLLALNGATQYEVMSIHAHAQASTSEVYTKDVERRELARLGVSKLANMEW